MLTFALPVLAHPYHVTLAEAELNEETNHLEVSLHVFAEDLENALSARAGSRIALESTEDVDDRITEYFSNTWHWRTPGAVEPEDGWPASEILWVGKKIDIRDIWLYFEVAVPGELESLELGLHYMFETEPTQENMLRLSVGKQKATIGCTSKSPWRAIEFEPDSQESVEE